MYVHIHSTNAVLVLSAQNDPATALVDVWGLQHLIARKNKRHEKSSFKLALGKALDRFADTMKLGKTERDL